MKRSDVEKFLEIKVAILLFDETVELGYLKKSNLSNPNVPFKNCYFTTDEKDQNAPNGSVFRCSHIKRIERY